MPLVCRTLQIRYSGGGGGDGCGGDGCSGDGCGSDGCGGGKGDIGVANFVGTYPYG